jgi:hypothetical protein
VKSAFESFGEVAGTVADQLLMDEKLLLLWADIDGDSLGSEGVVVQVSISEISLVTSI